MDSVVAWLSAGRIVDRLARILGWSPIGRTLVFDEVEGPLASTHSGQTCRVLEESDAGLRVETDASGPPTHGTSGEYLLLSPRHQGWTARSLMLTRVAFVVRDASPQAGVDRASIAVVSVRKTV
jgi:hypothetical protein